MLNRFEAMTQEEALEYCDINKMKYIACGHSLLQFEALRAMVLQGELTPLELPEYGMNFEEIILPETRIKQLEDALKPFAALYDAAREPDHKGPGVRRGYSLAHGYNVGDPSGADVTDDDYRNAYKVLHGGF